MRAAAVQLNAQEDKQRNLEVAAGLVRDAARAGADLVALPEKWNLLGTAEALLAGGEELESGPSLTAARGWARELGIHLVAAGHHATERLGVQALAAHLAERFGLAWHFVEIDNPV